MKRLIKYIFDTKDELQHVSWPTRYQTTAFTIMVILISLGVAAYLGAFDFIIARLLEMYVI